MATHHELSDKWVLWAHLPHDTSWTLESYKKILGFNIASFATFKIIHGHK